MDVTVYRIYQKARYATPGKPARRRELVAMALSIKPLRPWLSRDGFEVTIDDDEAWPVPVLKMVSDR